jgi:hypothetical protein
MSNATNYPLKMRNLPLYKKIALVSVALYLVITFAIAIVFILNY